MSTHHKDALFVIADELETESKTGGSAFGVLVQVNKLRAIAASLPATPATDSGQRWRKSRELRITTKSGYQFVHGGPGASILSLNGGFCYYLDEATRELLDEVAAMPAPAAPPPPDQPAPDGMVYPPKPAPRHWGYIPDGSGVEWAAYDTSQMEAYARAAYAAGLAAATPESECNERNAVSAEPVAKLHSDGYWTHEPGRDPFDRFGPNANASSLNVYTHPTPADSDGPAMISNPEAWPPNYAAGWNDCLLHMASGGGLREAVPDEWRTLVQDLADDLESEIQSRAHSELQRRIERDMEIVHRARAMLAAVPASGTQPAIPGDGGAVPYGWVEPQTGNFAFTADIERERVADPEAYASWSVAVYTTPPRSSEPAGVVPEGLPARIEAAIQRIANGHAPRRIPADPTDVDLVLAEVQAWIKGAWPPFWIATAPAPPAAPEPPR